MSKVSAYTEDTAPTVDDFTYSVDTSTNSGKRVTWANIAKMIATYLFGGAFSTYTNTGTAQGTFYYLNVGGLKFLWGTTGDCATSTSSVAYGVNLPASFFSAVHFSSYSVSSVGVDTLQWVTGNGVTVSGGFATTASFYTRAFAGGTGSTLRAAILLIGT